MPGLKYWALIHIGTTLLISCNSIEYAELELPGPLFSQAKTFLLNTNNGYVVNTVSGDTITPLINRHGDTLITGKPLTIQGKKMAPTSVAKHGVVAGDPKVVAVHHKVYPIPEKLSIDSVSKESLRTFVMGKDHSSSALSNSTGSTLPTGVLVPAKGIVTPCLQPKPVFASLPAFKDAAVYNVKYLDEDQGMNSSRVWSLLEDSRGNLWFGTHSGGATKYDGEKFTFYTKNEGLSGNIITAMLEDKHGNIWFGTLRDGVSMFNGQTFINYSTNEGFNNNHVWSILEDRNGNIWIGTDGGVSKFDGEHFTHYTTKEGLSHNMILSLMEDRNGNIWFGTGGGGVNKFDGERFVHYSISKGLNGDRIPAMLEDKVGNLWFGTAGAGLSKFNGETLTHFTTSEGLSDNVITSLLEDEKGNIWVGTESGGLNYYDGESFSQITASEGLSDNTITSILEDRNGYLWAGTQDGGVNILDRTSFTHFTALDKLNGSHVRSILEDASGNFWFSTWGGGVIVYDGEHLKQYTTSDGLCGNTVWSMLEDENGNLWFGIRNGGACMFDGDKFIHLLSDFSVWSMARDGSGNLWFGTGGEGVIKYDGENFIQYSTEQGFNGDRIWSLIEDSRGNMWFATWGGGVSMYDGKSFTFYTEKEGLIDNDVWSILEDRRGNLWFGTYGKGISIFDGESFTQLTTKEGLSNNIVNSILEDRSGNIWLGTESGLTQIMIDQDSAESKGNEFTSQNLTKVRNYSRYDGLKAGDFNVHSTFLDSENRIWWGTGKSLVMLDMNNIDVDRETPSVYLDQVDIGGQFIDYNNLNDSIKSTIKYSGVERFSNRPLDLEVPYNSNHLTFHFSGNNNALPHTMMYSYKLAGVGHDWSPPTTEAKAEYRNIPYGKHTFLVCAAGKSLEWSAPFGYTFMILPPWWQTWWARILYFCSAIILITGIVRLRTSRLKHRQKELEQTVAERTAEVVAQTDEAIAQKKRSDELLLNILPAEVAEELKETGHTRPVYFEEVSILFADFKEFTQIVASIPGNKLVEELDDIFQHFDDIMEDVGLEKIQTIGDAYVAAGGLPKEDPAHAIKCVKAAMHMIEYLAERNESSSIKWKLRVGIHSGPITAGVVGKKKFTYDIFGDTVNIAARIESSSEEGCINISAYTHDLVRDHFSCEYRGKINAKGKGDLDMYFVKLGN